MDLREYLFRKRIQINEFAEEIGYDRSYVGDIVNNKKKPSRRLAKVIQEATNGEVSVEELLQIPKSKGQ